MLVCALNTTRVADPDGVDLDPDQDLTLGKKLDQPQKENTDPNPTVVKNTDPTL